MNFIYKLVVFAFLVNVAAGIITSPSITGWEVDFQDKVKSYDEINSSISGMGSDPTTNPEVSEQSTSIFDDLFGIEIFSWYYTIKDFLNQYLYGLIGIILSLIPFEPEAFTVIKNLLYTVVTLIYGFGLVMFITGKKVNE